MSDPSTLALGCSPDSSEYHRGISPACNRPSIGLLHHPEWPLPGPLFLGVISVGPVCTRPAPIDTNDLLGRQLLLPAQINDPGEYVGLLEKLDFLPNHEPKTGGNLKDGDDRPVRATTEFGATNQVRRSDAQHLEMKGWAFLPDENVPAPAVLLAYRDGKRWQPFEICKTGESRRDIAARFHNREYLTTGWSRTFSRDTLPDNTEFVSAWAIDPYSAKTYKLPVDFRVPK